MFNSYRRGCLVCRSRRLATAPPIVSSRCAFPSPWTCLAPSQLAGRSDKLSLHLSRVVLNGSLFGSLQPRRYPPGTITAAGLSPPTAEKGLGNGEDPVH